MPCARNKWTMIKINEIKQSGLTSLRHVCDSGPTTLSSYVKRGLRNLCKKNRQIKVNQVIFCMDHLRFSNLKVLQLDLIQYEVRV